MSKSTPTKHDGRAVLLAVAELLICFYSASALQAMQTVVLQCS